MSSRTPSPSPRSRLGLTLIEVMLAVTILGIGIVSLVSAASRCLAVVRRARTYETVRHLLARVEVEHPLQLEEEIEEGSDGGTFEGDYSAYRWSREIKLVNEEEEEDGLYEIHTRVYWSDKTEGPYEEIVTYLFKPPKDKS